MQTIAMFASVKEFLNSDEQRTPKHNPKITGTWHYWDTGNGVFFVCFRPADKLRLVEHLQSLGAVVMSEDLEPVGDAVANHPLLSGIGVASTDTGYAAAKKLAKHFAWPHLDPRLQHKENT